MPAQSPSVMRLDALLDPLAKAFVDYLEQASTHYLGTFVPSMRRTLLSGRCSSLSVARRDAHALDTCRAMSSTARPTATRVRATYHVIRVSLHKSFPR